MKVPIVEFLCKALYNQIWIIWCRFETLLFETTICSMKLPASVGSKPTFWQTKLFDKASRAKLFAFKTEPNRAFDFSKLSYF